MNGVSDSWLHMQSCSKPASEAYKYLEFLVAEEKIMTII